MPTGGISGLAVGADLRADLRRAGAQSAATAFGPQRTAQSACGAAGDRRRGAVRCGGGAELLTIFRRCLTGAGLRAMLPVSANNAPGSLDGGGSDGGPAAPNATARQPAQGKPLTHCPQWRVR